MFDFMMEMLEKLGNAILSVLPKSPVQGYVSIFSELPYLKWLNWFVPVADILAILDAWLLSIALFYIYSVAMRWVKLIGD